MPKPDRPLDDHPPRAQQQVDDLQRQLAFYRGLAEAPSLATMHAVTDYLYRERNAEALKKCQNSGNVAVIHLDGLHPEKENTPDPATEPIPEPMQQAMAALKELWESVDEEVVHGRKETSKTSVIYRDTPLRSGPRSRRRHILLAGPYGHARGLAASDLSNYNYTGNNASYFGSFDGRRNYNGNYRGTHRFRSRPRSPWSPSPPPPPLPGRCYGPSAAMFFWPTRMPAVLPLRT
ncbi:hypothetical protein F5X68DRAFT_237423 [Plectosphaerella plurivora]|uniref:Uncharacterized protein n=1 Tax=Plectosphaerella plurivora TaxID=936078 RepID=A0A9P8V0J1_9PEZI|nr:hypothetical protein F5X68DRAFT_237423 [Plectosphaerella plurivora]